MKRQTSIWCAWAVVAACALAPALTPSAAHAQYAVEVLSYTAGATPSPGFTTTPAAALGEPERITGESIGYPNVVTPFNPPFLASDLISIGKGGQITLRLSNFAIPQPGTIPEIGVFGNVGINDLDYPNGQAGSAHATLSPLDEATVDVSADGINWVNLGTKVFDIPTNGYTDVSNFSTTRGSAPSDFRKPFLGSLSDFDDRSYSSMLSLLNGSGGGTWLDISSAGIAQVGYIRFSRDNTSDPDFSANFDLDAVVVSQAALGVATVPEPSTGLLAVVVIGLLVPCRRHRSHGDAAAECRRIPSTQR